MTNRECNYATINRLAANPETAKDALILWLALRLMEAHQALSQIANVTGTYERTTSGAGRKGRRSTTDRSQAEDKS